jgi:hypothetical protein
MSKLPNNALNPSARGRLNKCRAVRHLALWIAVVLGLAHPAAGQVSKEYTLKAAFLFKLTRYVQWPESAAPFSIGIVGNDPFGNVLDQIVSGESVNKRAVVVKRSRNLADLKDCDVLFVSSSEKDQVPQLLRELDQSKTLIIGDTDGFCRKGGIVNLIIENGRLSFEINPRAAKKHGIVIDPQVLSLAKIVESEPG